MLCVGDECEAGVCMEGEYCVREMSVGLVPVWKLSVVWGWCLYGR